MGILLTTVAVSLFLVAIVGYVPSSLGQQNASLVLRPPPVDIKELMFAVSPLIKVEYQGESVIVLKADEDTLLLTNSSMSPFWKAIDAVKHYGYSLADVTTSGMGSQGNPTRFYAIMTKP